MLIRKIYEFPRPEVEGIQAVEKVYMELLSKKRDAPLDDEESDFFDYANNVLLEAA